MHICRTLCALFARLVGQPVRQVRWQVAGAEHAGALGRDAIEVRRPRAVDLQECAEHRRDQDGAAVVRLEFDIQRVHVGLVRAPFSGRRIDRRPGRRAAPLPRPERLAELLRELAEQVLRGRGRRGCG